MNIGIIRFRSFTIMVQGNVNKLHKRHFSINNEILDESLQHSDNSSKFVDRVIIELKGGRGGNGCVSYNGTRPCMHRDNY